MFWEAQGSHFSLIRAFFSKHKSIRRVSSPKKVRCSIPSLTLDRFEKSHSGTGRGVENTLVPSNDARGAPARKSCESSMDTFTCPTVGGNSFLFCLANDRPSRRNNWLTLRYRVTFSDSMTCLEGLWYLVYVQDICASFSRKLSRSVSHLFVNIGCEFLFFSFCFLFCFVFCFCLFIFVCLYVYVCLFVFISTISDTDDHKLRGWECQICKVEVCGGVSFPFFLQQMYSFEFITSTEERGQNLELLRNTHYTYFIIFSWILTAGFAPCSTPF